MSQSSKAARGKRSLSARQVGLKYGFRSGLEKDVAKHLEGLLGPSGYSYESMKIRYIKPAKTHTYTPDFILQNGIIIETKGRMTTQDRQKHLLIQDQYPNLDIRFVFNNPNQRINKRSRTTYAMWCEKHGFRYAKGLVPKEWTEEPDHN